MGPEKIRNDKVDRKWQNNAYQKGICGRRVLIEPYWNVNLNSSYSFMFLPRINRTILECKLTKFQFLGAISDVLIEPYWNVNRYAANAGAVGEKY